MNLSTPLLTTLLLVPSLSAQEVRFGLQVHANLPSADLKELADSKAAFGGGAHMTFDLGEGHVIRPRIDYMMFPENKSFLDASVPNIASGKSKMDAFSAGADYLFFFEGQDTGFYLTGGVSWNRWKYDYDYSIKVGPTTVTGSASRATNKVGGAAGVGFNLNRSFGVEARYLASKFENANGDAVNAGVVQLSASYRF